MKKTFLVILLFLFVGACQTTKDVLTLKKKESGDEFLVEKKNPLVLPPDYGELPLPGNIENIEETKIDKNEVKILVTSDKVDVPTNEVIKNSQPTAIEKSILKKIK